MSKRTQCKIIPSVQTQKSMQASKCFFHGATRGVFTGFNNNNNTRDQRLQQQHHVDTSSALQLLYKYRHKQQQQQQQPWRHVCRRGVVFSSRARQDVIDVDDDANDDANNGSGNNNGGNEWQSLLHVSKEAVEGIICSCKNEGGKNKENLALLEFIAI